MRYFRHSSYGSIANLSCHICKFKLKHFCFSFWIIRWHISATACNINYGNLLFIYIDIRLIYVSITCNFHIDIILEFTRRLMKKENKFQKARLIHWIYFIRCTTSLHLYDWNLQVFILFMAIHRLNNDINPGNFNRCVV